MKKLILSLVAMATLSLSSFGQSPEGFKYQAIVRDAGNLILNNQAVGMQMTIQQGSIGGPTVYQETFAPTTNGYGLVNLEIGSGTVVSGTFATIDWSAGPYFMETAVDVTGGTSYVVMGTSQLMSVPYALHAKTAETSIIDNVNDADNDPTNELQDWSNLPNIPVDFSDNVDNVDDADNDPTNEIETWSTLAGIPADIADGDDVNDADNDPTNELQDWTTLPNIPAGFSDNIDNVDDADNDPLNEIELPAGGTEGQVLTIIAGTPQWVTPSASASNIQDSLDSGITPCQLTAMGFPVDSLYGKTWAGGQIFYFDNVSCTGLVSAPSDQSPFADWGCASASAGTSYQGIGGCTDVGSANYICNNLTLNTFTDWFLPNVTELDLMYKHLHSRGFGGFPNNNYWSSSEFSSISAWFQFFGNGNQGSSIKFNSNFVRAVRAF
jgi:hypothetical protein